MTAHNFPAQPTPFVGREQELAELFALLEDPATRLVTILGPGGMGKTRLALEVAAGQLPSCPEGVFFVPLAPLSTAENIVTTVADAVGFQFFGGSDPGQQLVDHFRTKALLLVLDNFEHLLEGASFVSDLLTAAPAIKVLVTSRARLNLRGETVFTIGGLETPEESGASNLLEYAAVRLFLQTARRLTPGYALKGDDVGHMSVICRMVEGMPLGIELAAAWVAMLPLADIVAEIETSLDFLATDMQDMPERLRSIRAVFERSWNLLTDDERAIFKQLSIFRGGFQREAAQAVTGTSLRQLTTLVNKSLLGRPTASGRYVVHELLRQYAEEKLDETPAEREQILDRHCAYYATFFQQREDGFFRGNEQEREVLTDIENIRAAWRWAVTQERIADIHNMILGLHILHESLGTWVEGAATFEWVADRLREEAPAGQKGIALGLILAIQSFFFRRIGRLDRAKPLIREGIALLRRLNARQELGWAYIFLHSHGTPYEPEIIEDYAELSRLLQTALAIFEEAGHERGITWTLLTLGNVANDHADYDRAIDYYQRGLYLARTRHSHRGMGWALWGLANCAVAQGDFETARTYIAEVVDGGKEAGPRLVFYVSLLGEVDYALGDYPAAWRSFCRILQIAVDRPFLTAQSLTTLLWLARILLAQDKAMAAVEILTLVQTHSTSTQSLKDDAEELFGRLKTELPAEQFEAAYERGKALQLETLISQILQEHEANQVARVSEAGRRVGDDLTARELEILRLVAEGRSNREIAAELVIALGTVKWYISQIYSKLHVQSRTQAIRRARDLNLLT